MMAHTPGPWKVEYDPYDDGTPYFRIVAGDQSSRDIKTMGFRLSGIMRADDAALIGASPDLLEILMEILEYQGHAEHAMDDRYVVERAREVISKATEKGVVTPMTMSVKP